MERLVAEEATKGTLDTVGHPASGRVNFLHDLKTKASLVHPSRMWTMNTPCSKRAALWADLPRSSSAANVWGGIRIVSVLWAISTRTNTV